MSTEPGYAASRKKNGQITPYNPTQCAPSPRAMRTRDTTHGVLLGRTHRLLGLTRITLLPLVLTLSRIIQRRVVTLSCALYDAVCGSAMRPSLSSIRLKQYDEGPSLSIAMMNHAQWKHGRMSVLICCACERSDAGPISPRIYTGTGLISGPPIDDVMSDLYAWVRIRHEGGDVRRRSAYPRSPRSSVSLVSP